jgi:fucose permease
MFLIMGVLGMFVKGVLLKPMNDFFGERRVIIIAFLFGTLTNLLYGLATNKGTIFVALGMSVFIGVSFPTISAIKSNNVVSPSRLGLFICHLPINLFES